MEFLILVDVARRIGEFDKAENFLNKLSEFKDLSVKRPELLEEIEKQFQKAYLSISFF